MENRRNYYRILHVQPDAPVEIVRASYRTLMQKLKAHPDLGGDEWNASLLNQAYAVIGDPVKRAQYDAEKRFFVKAGSTAHQTETPGKSTGYESNSQDPHPDADTITHCPFCKCSVRAVSRYTANSCDRCGSPLQKVEHLHLNTTDKRSVMRMDKTEHVQFFTEWPQKQPFSGQLMDLSPNGLGLISPLWLPSMLVIFVVGDLFSASARVVNCHAKQGNSTHAYQIGAKFITLRYEHNRGTFVSAKI